MARYIELAGEGKPTTNDGGSSGSGKGNQREGTDVSEYGKVRKIRERRREANTNVHRVASVHRRCRPTVSSVS